MINQQTAKDHNIKIINSNKTLGDSKMMLIEKLKVLLPSVINSDNQLDTKALADVVDIANTTSNNQGYELTFAGKGIARALADSPTELELKTEIAQSKDFDNTENVLIRGDNLEVLKILQANYHKKIKMIYIDPPYNTKNENFIYKDNFKTSDTQLIENFSLDEDAVDFLQNVYGTRSHSGWLSFIYPRLKLARDLLTDDGVIFISIDDNEQANLKILCDEIFGEDNFLGKFVVQSTPNGMDYGHIANQQEYAIFYSKNKNEIITNLLPSKDKSFSFRDNISQFNTHPLYNSNEAFHKDNRPNLFYPFFLDVNTKNKDGFYQISLEKKENSIEIYPPLSQKNKVQFVWRWGKELSNKNMNVNIIGYKNKNGEYRIIQKMRHNEKLIRSIMHDKEVSSRKGTAELEKLLECKAFNFPKPTALIKRFSTIATNSNDIILDFFAGSGTTADAIMQLNAEDSGKRKFILVQIDEPIIKKKSPEAHKFCTDNKFKPVISSITIERLNRAGDKITNDFKQQSNDLFKDKKLPDVGYKVFSCTSKPTVKQDESACPGTDIFNVVNNRANSLDTLVNMLVATCKTLDSKITCLIADKLYQADGEIYLLDNTEQKTLAEYQNCKINLDGWADIDLTQYLNLSVGQKDNISVIY